MTPLQTFLKISQKLAARPFEFIAPGERTPLLKEIAAALEHLRLVLERQNLSDTLACRQVLALQKTVSASQLDEATFTQHLVNLIELYRLAPASESAREFFNAAEAAAVKAKQRILEYHLSLEHLAKQGENLSPAEKSRRDLETLQKVGVFYVLEYTLQALYEFSRLSAADQAKLLKDGLKTAAGSLPAYLPLEDSFRRELCLKIFGESLRRRLLNIFYIFEETLWGGVPSQIGPALKRFNLELLQACADQGLKKFKAVAYAPFGNDAPLEEVIKKVSSINLL